MKKLIFLLISCALILTSCSKYEDNEGIQLTSKRDRLAQEWRAEKAIFNGSVIYPDMEIMFSYDEFAGIANGTIYGGDWDFEDGKESMRLDYDYGAVEIWEIKRLEKDHLWVDIKTVGFSDIIYVEFESVE